MEYLQKFADCEGTTGSVDVGMSVVVQAVRQDGRLQTEHAATIDRAAPSWPRTQCPSGYLVRVTDAYALRRTELAPAAAAS